MKLQKYSFGIGDRFGHQGQAQLAAIMKAKEHGVEIAPVWNKSFREHSIIGSTPMDVRKEADQAVDALKWTAPYYVDADHVNINNVDGFIRYSDFFTLDVAEYIGKSPGDDELKQFTDSALQYVGLLSIPDIEETFEITKDDILRISNKYLFAVQKAAHIYSHIESIKGKDAFITEISMDETNVPQSPVEMFFILLMVAKQKIPAQTIAPKFTGRFNKGINYVGNIKQFEKEFNQDVAVINFAIRDFGLPENLKLSIHSGSDKFAIYKPINKALRRFDAGVHIKTAGTTWLEEIIGLADAGDDGLRIAKEIYAKSLEQYDELCAPYEMVIDINKDALPSLREVAGWGGREYADTLRHDPDCPTYNHHFRQLLHVGYKVAAQKDSQFTDALRKYENIIAAHVTENIYQRHLKPIFLDKP